MAAPTVLSPQEVARALQTLSDEKTRQLVFRLGVEMHVLDNIDSGFPVGCRSDRYIQAWLERDTGASWQKIVSGLEEIEMDVLAKDLAIQHGLPAAPASVDVNQSSHQMTPPVVVPSSPPASGPAAGELNPVAKPSSPTPSTDKVSQVGDNIERFDDTFSNLMFEARSELCLRESVDPSFLDRFCSRLLGLSVAQKATHVKFFRESEDEILEAKSIRKVFAILSRYVSYRNYEILQHIIKKFCGAVLQQKMQEYCQSLEEFEKATAIDIYLAAISACPELSLAFIKMAVKINKPASVCTLHEVRKLKDALAEKASLHSYGMYVESMSESSVLLVLRFPESCVGWIVAALTCKFLQEHLLSDVIVDGRKLTTVQASQRWLEHYIFERVDPPADYREMNLQDRYRWMLNDQLIAASRAGDVVRVVSLLNTGADINTVDRVISATALDRASWYGHLQVVRLLLGRWSEVECRNWNGWTPLITAAASGKYDVVLDLLDSGADVNAHDNDGDSALIRAARWHHTEVVVELVKANANLDLQDKYGYSALILAARYGHTEVVVELVKAKANLDLQNKDGYSALMRAAYLGNTDIVVELVKAGGALLDLQNTRGDSAVIMATVEHRSDALRVLVDAGSDLNVQNGEGLTAVMISARSGRSDITDILVEGEHIDLDIQENITGWSALHFAAERRDVTTTQSLLEAGANALLKDKNGLTALEVARASSDKVWEDADELYWDDEYSEWQQRAFVHDYDGVVDLLSGYTAEPAVLSSHPEQNSTPGQQDTITDQDSTPGQQDTVTDQDSTPGQQDTITDQDSTLGQQDTVTDHDSTPGQQDTVTDQDSATTKQIIPTSGQRRRSRGVSQALRNLVNVSGQRIQQLFNDFHRRLKSADKKDQMWVRGQEGDGVQKKHKTRTTGHRGPPDDQTTSTSITSTASVS